MHSQEQSHSFIATLAIKGGGGRCFNFWTVVLRTGSVKHPQNHCLGFQQQKIDNDGDNHDGDTMIVRVRVDKVWTLCAAAEETIGKSSSQCSCLLLLDAKYQMDKSYIVARRSTKYQMKKISQFSNPSGHIDLRSIESKFI